MMKEIYARAHRVLIYAGEEADESGHVLDLIGDLRQPVHLYDTPQTPIDLGKFGLVRAFRCLLSRSWFRRTWVRNNGIARFVIFTSIQRSSFTGPSRSIPCY